MTSAAASRCTESGKARCHESVPLASKYGVTFAVSQFRSIVMRAGTDPAHVKRMSEALDKVDFLADPAAKLAEAMGLAKDNPGLGGTRFARFAMIVRNGTVRHIFVQDVQGVTVSGAPAILLALQGEAVA